MNQRNLNVKSNQNNSDACSQKQLFTIKYKIHIAKDKECTPLLQIIDSTTKTKQNCKIKQWNEAVLPKSIEYIFERRP